LKNLARFKKSQKLTHIPKLQLQKQRKHQKLQRPNEEKVRSWETLMFLQRINFWIKKRTSLIGK